MLSPVRIALLIALGLCAETMAQRTMVTTQVPFRTNRDSFYEGTNIGWGVRGPGFAASFNQGGVTPPFGRANPNAGFNTGFGFGNGNFGGNLNLGAYQGGSRFSSSVTPVLTTTNGYPGSLFVGSVRPFVTGFVPVVGGNFQANRQVAAPSPLDQRIARFRAGERAPAPTPNRMALNGQAGVNPQVGLRTDQFRRPTVDPLPPTRAERQAEQARQSAADHAKAIEYWNRGRQSEEGGRSSFAKSYYELALRLANEPLRSQIERRLRDLR